MTFFLHEKNEFMSNFANELEANKTMTRKCKENCIVILEILKSGLEDIIKDYKNLKQNMLRKMKKKDSFWKMKEDFIGRLSGATTPGFTERITAHVVPQITKAKPIEKPVVAPPKQPVNILDFTTTSTPNNDEGYREAPEVVNIFKENESKGMEKTKQILFELSDLMTNFSTKVHQHHEITQNSKYLLLTLSCTRITSKC
jgi:hypothetical protein